jgi:hypothetical protein
VSYDRPIISNKEVISVNQAWAGESGNLFASSAHSIKLQPNSRKQLYGQQTEEPIEAVEVGAWQQWSKKISTDTGATAVLLMNNGWESSTITLNFASVPSLKIFPANQSYSVRCLYGHKVSFRRSFFYLLFDSDGSCRNLVSSPDPGKSHWMVMTQGW